MSRGGIFCAAPIPLDICSRRCAPLALLVFLAACGEAEVDPVPDFSGYWEHAIAHYLPPEEGPGPVANMPGLTFAAMNLWIGDYRNPILQPWASEVVKEHDIAELERGEPLWGQLQLCMPFGVPHALLLREPVQFLQEPGAVTILYQHDNQIRHIYLNEKHPRGLSPTPYGHSVGHYEGDTLVVDTVGMSNTGAIDFYGTPHTEVMHVVERYRMDENRTVLSVEFSVEDPRAFTTSWRGAQRYYRSSEYGFREYICADNIRHGTNGNYPVPVDNSPDF